MYTFINYLKALAAILITNSHYGGIWPIESMAMGGLLGDVIFLAVSGFCLYDIKLPFVKWYGKRIIRIYPIVWITGIFAVVIGFFHVADFNSLVHLFVYPTYYHFVESIMLLYIFYYILLAISHKYNVQCKWIMLIVGGIYIGIYLFMYDKTYYHIDSVEEPIIRFLFLESMLLGAYFRENIKIIKGALTKIDIMKLFIFLVMYFGSKIAFSRLQIFSSIQIVNQIVLLGALYYIFRTALVMELQNSKVMQYVAIEKIIKSISSITLEIYLTQYLVYYLIPDFIFPINFFVVTSMITLFASIVHFCWKYIKEKSSLIMKGIQR